jgi:hypothetical protein
LDYSAEVKMFLCETGLPKVSSLPMEYIADGRTLDGNLVLGDTYGSKTVLIRGLESVMVEYVTAEQMFCQKGIKPVPSMALVNTSVFQYHDFLCLYESFVTDPKNETDDADYIKPKIAELKREMQRIDQPATILGSLWGDTLEELPWLGE